MSLRPVTRASALRESATKSSGPPPTVAVVGAGAFGGWTALHLQRLGAAVTLLDAWGPGNARASSGGETRVLRRIYRDRFYIDMAGRAMEEWRDSAGRWGVSIYRRTGALFMARAAGNEFLSAARRQAGAAGVAHDVLDADELAHRFPQVNASDVEWALLEHDAGVVLARRACSEVVGEFVMNGGDFRLEVARPGPIRSGRLDGLLLADGGSLRADHYVFASGPWLPRMFPEVVGSRLQVSRQEVFFFGTPDGMSGYDEGSLPVWADCGERFWYGIPAGEYRGFKVADHSHGSPMDPTAADRIPGQAGIRAARQFLEERFPGMRGAPILETRVCQYTSTASEDFIADRHPGADNAWLVGGGSGHGFKHAPAFGELVAAQVIGHRDPEPRFLLNRHEGLSNAHEG